MTNLTLALDETIVRKARIRAINEGTSVSAKLRELLALYANGQLAEVSQSSVPLPVFDGSNGVHKGIDATSNRAMLAAADNC